MPNTPLLPPRNVVVIGAPRSGTTLLGALICEAKEAYPMLPECTYVTQLMQHFHDIVHYSDAPRFEAFARDEPSLRAIYQEAIVRFLEIAKSHFPAHIYTQLVLKDPMLTLIPDLIPVFLGVEAKTVCVVRDPRAVIASMVRVLRKKGGDIIPCSHAASVPALWWAKTLLLLKTGLARARCRPAELALADALANLSTANDDVIAQIFNFYSRFHGSVLYKNGLAHTVKYEDLVARNEKSFEDLAHYLGFAIGKKGFGKTFFAFDTSDPTHSDNYGKAIQAKDDHFEDTLAPDQIIKIQEVFSGLNLIYHWW